MKGYYNRPAETAEAFRGGWFHTGDIGTLDEDGYLTIVDRRNDMILRGGFNVYPREIEELMMTHPAVALVAVIGVPDERLGEEVKALVVRRPGVEVTEPELVDWCRDQCAAYKYPALVEFRDALPVGATGKILKRELRELSLVASAAAAGCWPQACTSPPAVTTVRCRRVGEADRPDGRQEKPDAQVQRSDDPRSGLL